MDEHHHPKPALQRPNLEILRLKQAVAASKNEKMDRDTAEFMRDLSSLADWMDHLERKLAEATAANDPDTTPNP